MINAISSTNFDVVLIDLFFMGIAFASSEINQLKRKVNGGQRLVISYINIDAAEKFHYYWKKDRRLQKLNMKICSISLKFFSLSFRLWCL